MKFEKKIKELFLIERWLKKSFLKQKYLYMNNMTVK